MTDLSFSGLLSFNSTSVTVAPKTDAGRAFFAAMFGDLAVSVEMPKTRAADLTRFASSKGLTWEAA